MNIIGRIKPPLFNKVTHVIFDLDGVILDTEEIYRGTINSIAKRYGKTYTPEIRAKVVGTVETDTARIAVQEMGLPITPENFLKEFKSLTKQRFQTGVSLMPGAERLIRHLHRHRIPIAVGTSSSKDGFDIKTSTHQQLFRLFSHCVVGGSDPEVKQGKPSPDIFSICAQRFSGKPTPASCLVFEDALNGVKAAISAGMQVVMIPDKQMDPAVGKDATVVLRSLEAFEPEMFDLPSFKEE